MRKSTGLSRRSAAMEEARERPAVSAIRTEEQFPTCAKMAYVVLCRLSLIGIPIPAFFGASGLASGLITASM